MSSMISDGVQFVGLWINETIKGREPSSELTMITSGTPLARVLSLPSSFQF